MQKITDDPLTECTECGGKLTRLISLSSFHLKGQGWYKTDYGSTTHAPTNGKSDKFSEGEKSEAKMGGAETSESKKSDGEKTKSKTGSDSSP
jgi:predicted nucleic acid-binding Zn ribbon protein